MTWLEERASNRWPVALVWRDETGLLVGIWPFIEVPAIGGKGLWPAVSEVANLSEPLIDPASQIDIENIRVGLSLLLKEYCFIWVPLLTETWLKRYLPDYGKSIGAFARCRERSRTLYADLAVPQFEDYLSSVVGAKTRKMLRYDTGQLSKRGPISFRVCKNPAEIQQNWVELESIEMASWKRTSPDRHLSHPLFRSFYRKLLPKLAAAGRIEITMLIVGDMAVAFEMGLIGQGYYGLYHIAYLEDFARTSPGKQLLMHNLERSHREGRFVFDFMQGNHEYKRRFKTSTEMLSELLLCPRTVRGALNYYLTRILSRKQKAT